MFFPLPKDAKKSSHHAVNARRAVIKSSTGLGASASAGAVKATGTATTAGAVTLTHMLGGIWASGHPAFMVGCPWFVLGKYEETDGTFTNVTEAQPIDSATSVIWSTVGQVDDGRTLHVGWFNYGVGCLTTPRDITYDPSLKKLIALPVEEMKLLHGASLGNHSAVQVQAGSPLNVFGPITLSTAFDLEVQVALPTGKAVSFGAAIMAANQATSEVLVSINISTASSGVRVVNMSTTCPHAPKGVNTTLSFLLPDAPSFALRVLADRTIVEVFAGSGRGVVSMPVLKPGADATKGGVFIFPMVSTASLTVQSADASSMGCGWAKYP